MSEQSRRANNTTRALELLQRKRRVTNAELLAIAGFRFGARLKELRDGGHDIVTEERAGGLVFYEYRGMKHAGQIELFA
jgi:hypothetical protein